MDVCEALRERIRELELALVEARNELDDAGYRYRGVVSAWGKALGVDRSYERVPDNALAADTRAMKARLAAAEAEVARYKAAERMEQRGGYIHLQSVA